MENLICFEDLSIKYRDGKGILDECSFVVEPGDVILLEGSNGSGKSTLLKTILGLELHEKIVSGCIVIDGFGDVLAMSDKERMELRRHVSYLKQKDDYDAFLGYTVMDVVVDYFAAYLGRHPNKEELSSLTALFEHYIPREANIKTSSKIKKLSGGQQRLVSIFASLCLKPDSPLYIIDEPLNNLDIGMVKHINNVINQLRIDHPTAAFIIISHCKIFPFINKVMTIKDGDIDLYDGNTTCYACFGKANEKGYY